MPDELTTVFLDRDGTINVKAPEGDYVKSWEEFELLPGAVEAVRALRDAGLRVVIVTNQRGIALGRMTEDDLAEIHSRMLEQLGPVDAVYHCPHDEGECDCRKPLPGMLVRAAEEVPGVDLARSVTIGDSESDMEAGRAAGTRTLLIGRDAPSLAAAVEGLLRAV
ncbi:MAG: D-glycero-D-manno-heptose 1,7-bisphosphate phosphatase [Thermoleophilaceae bacterium]|nr:D-glycero-D-manno-heptose 1,7-bisphosphate phosphatase [Thermoleophilaceae bacterium]